MLWRRHYWTIKPQPLPTLKHFVLCINVLELLPETEGAEEKKKILRKRLLILLMTRRPFKSCHSHSQMDEYGRSGPHGSEVIPTFLPLPSPNTGTLRCLNVAMIVEVVTG